MKTIRMIILAVGMVSSLHLLHAQTTTVGSFNGYTRQVQSAQTDSVVGVVAEAQGLTLMPPDQVPLLGTFWTVMPGTGGGVIPPFPCPPFDPSLPIYQIADGQFLVDETGGQVTLNTPQAGQLAASSMSAAALATQADAVLNLITQVENRATIQQMRTMARSMGMDVSSPGVDGSGDGFLSTFSSGTLDTNQLWLEITNVADGWTYLNLHNATNQVYAIWSTTNLLTPFSGWQVETEVWPDKNQNQPVTLFTVPMLERENLFVRAEDWTGVDSDGDGIPDWWIWKYFGDLSETATNLDASGNTLLSDYQNGLDPNVIQFNLSVTNNYVNSMSAPVQLNIICGEPDFVAVAVDDTKYATDANWRVYTGTNVAVNLGLAEGWHDVWIGLRGRPSDATQTWQYKRLKLDLTPPVLVITNPVISTVSVPVTVDKPDDSDEFPEWEQNFPEGSNGLR